MELITLRAHTLLQPLTPPDSVCVRVCVCVCVWVCVESQCKWILQNNIKVYVYMRCSITLWPFLHICSCKHWILVKPDKLLSWIRATRIFKLVYLQPVHLKTRTSPTSHHTATVTASTFTPEVTLLFHFPPFSLSSKLFNKHFCLLTSSHDLNPAWQRALVLLFL